MIIVHHLNNSRSQRILWFLEELAVPYRAQGYQRDSVTLLAAPELKKIHPLGKSPVPWQMRPIAGAIGKGVQREYLDKQIATHRDYLEQHLTANTWFVGNDFSAADIQMSFPLEALAARWTAALN